MERADVEAAEAAVAGLAALWIEAGMVVWLRTWLLSWGLAPAREQHRMVEEKAGAFLRAGVAAWAAAGSAAGRQPLNPLAAALAGTTAWTGALSHRARSNRRRLIRGVFPD
jgi:hypothetical protein